MSTALPGALPPALPAAPPSGPMDVLALQLANRNKVLSVPASILGAVVLVSILIGVAILRAGGSLSTSSYNSGVLWSLAGFMVALGVQNVSATFPFALALGSTRRAFVAGNLLTNATLASFVTALAVVLWFAEAATGGWFIGMSVLRVDSLGGGDLGGLLAWLGLGLMTALSVGGVYGASWIRFGALGPTLLTAGVVALNVVALLLFLPAIGTAFALFQPWWLAIAVGTVIVLSGIGQYLFLRGASVR